MRPKYFSHTKDPDTTILYGFGLDYIEDEVQKDAQTKK
jgi:hypothetical protein